MKPALTNQPTMPATTSGGLQQTDGHSNNVMAKRLLWLALGLGVAYLAYKEIPQSRRYIRLERM